MLIKDAKKITGDIGFTSKTGFAFGLPARISCNVGCKLAEKEGSTCFGCYARGGNYSYPSVKISHSNRLEGVQKLKNKSFREKWVKAMVTLIESKTKVNPKNTWYFRWHDSGDIVSVHHLRAIVDVCNALPKVKHWLPTKEIATVKRFLKSGETIPKNLCIRLSSFYVDKEDDFKIDLPKSIVYTEDANNASKCKAILEHKGCLEVGCRKCWNNKVALVGYKKHR